MRLVVACGFLLCIAAPLRGLPGRRPLTPVQIFLHTADPLGAVRAKLEECMPLLEGIQEPTRISKALREEVRPMVKELGEKLEEHSSMSSQDYRQLAQRAENIVELLLHIVRSEFVMRRSMRSAPGAFYMEKGDPRPFTTIWHDIYDDGELKTRLNFSVFEYLSLVEKAYFLAYGFTDIARHHARA